MKEIITQQEILLATGTSFSAGQFCEKDDTSNRQNLTEQEKLEDACWNGLLPDMLPELCVERNHAHPIYLWQATEGFHFVNLELADVPGKEKDHYFSIDPYVFLSAAFYN
jgi:hypothetical protein